MARRKIKWKFLSLVLLGAAIATEVRKPPGEREWHGRVAGVVPYDLRAPTFDRIKAALWNPSDDRIFTPNPFGVAWTINFAQVAELLKKARAREL